MGCGTVCVCVEATLLTTVTDADAEIKTRRGTMQQTKKCNALQDNDSLGEGRGASRVGRGKRINENGQQGEEEEGATQKDGRGEGALSVPALFSFQKLLRFRMLNYGH